MEEVYNYLIDFGFRKEDIDKIVNTYPLNELIPSTLLKYIKNDCDYLLELDYTKSQIIKMAKSFPKLFSFNVENISQKLENLILLGYSKVQVIKMTISVPSIFSLSIENVKQKLEDIMSLGYTQEEVKIITLKLPSIFGNSIEYIKQKLEDIMSLGYTQEEVKKMTLELPTLFSLSFENIPKKINFYKEIGLDFIVINDTKYLMQSVELSYARYNYVKNNNIQMKSYGYLFYNEKTFKNQFGVTKQELLQMYPYNKEEEIKDAR